MTNQKKLAIIQGLIDDLDSDQTETLQLLEGIYSDVRYQKIWDDQMDRIDALV